MNKKQLLTALLLSFSFMNVSYAEPSEQETIDFIREKFSICEYPNTIEKRYVITGYHPETGYKAKKIDTSFKFQVSGDNLITSRAGYTFVSSDTDKKYDYSYENTFPLSHLKAGGRTFEFYSIINEDSAIKKHFIIDVGYMNLLCDKKYGIDGVNKCGNKLEQNPWSGPKEISGAISSSLIIPFCNQLNNIAKERIEKAFNHLIKLHKIKYPPIEKKQLF